MVESTNSPGGVLETRHSRRDPRLALLARSRRVGALTTVAALAVSGVAITGLPGSIPYFGTPAASAETSTASWQVGEGYTFFDSQGGEHWLGGNANPSGRDGLLWCIEYGPMAIRDASKMVDWSDVTDADQRGDVDPTLKVTANQLAGILKWYEPTNTADSRAAIALLIHANFDLAPDAARITNEALAKYPGAAALAHQYVAEAKKGVINDASAGEAASEAAKRTGEVHGIAAKAEDGTILPGVDVTVTLNGPAVFDATGTNTWSGQTQSTPMTLTWTATGNGKVSYRTVYPKGRIQMWKYANDGTVQDMLERGNAVDMDPEEQPPVPTYFDFQPMATSSVADADAKVLDNGTTVLKDTIHVTADESYTQSPKWMYDAKINDLVPVVFEGTAYYTGDLPAAESGSVPAGAKVVGTTTVTAKGPGSYSAVITTDSAVDSQFVTWVWKMVKANQGDYSSYIAADWSDEFGLADETTSVRQRVEISSSVQSNVTHNGKYLVDSLYIDGFDDDHGDFEGGGGFGADVDEMTHGLYFFPKGLEVKNANIPQATLIAEVAVPAKNGYVDRLGSGKFKILDDSPDGVYAFRTVFPGDDRTMPYASSVEDPHEQVVVTSETPEIHTTAMDKLDGDKLLTPDDDGMVTATDTVCQVEGKELKIGKTYTLTATAMDKETGEAILDPDGKPYTGTAEFTPKSKSDCGIVDVKIPAWAVVNKPLVMFETVTLDGRTVAVHTDITDEGQTVEGPKPAIGTTLTDKSDGDHEVAPGPVTMADSVCPTVPGTFIPGQAYTLTGTLMDRATGKPLTGTDGKPVTASSEFTPKTLDECAIVEFAFDTSRLDGKELVAFEKVFDAKGQLIASHEDINDKGQTVRVTRPPVLAKTGAAVGGSLAGAVLLIGVGTALVRRRRGAVTQADAA